MSQPTNYLFRKISVFSILPLMLVSTVISPVAQAKVDDDFSNSEVELIKSISNESNKDQKKLKIEKESKKTTNLKLKDVLTNKIAVNTERKIETDKQNFVSKYDNANKNYSCWFGNGYENAFNSLGQQIWRFNLRIKGCADAGRVWSGQVIATWADINTVAWSYYGESNDRKFEYFTGSYLEWVGSRQGVFKLCVNNNFVCVQESRPWVEYHATREGYTDYWY
jgi:hypothetical protein